MPNARHAPTPVKRLVVTFLTCQILSTIIGITASWENASSLVLVMCIPNLIILSFVLYRFYVGKRWAQRLIGVILPISVLTMTTMAALAPSLVFSTGMMGLNNLLVLLCNCACWYWLRQPDVKRYFYQCHHSTLLRFLSSLTPCSLGYSTQ